ncbi:DUF3618 domain-containing protein [Parafrigoribacterium humi]|jgi:hypothetical protein|uniref:DUF3618 domain-containing protein n=1 Tax=Parafrigoribacterium humi TaxID=3144664 RepID=UPI0032EB2D3E
MSMPEPVIPAAEASISATRAQLEDTLDAIEDKLNVPKQAGRLARKARASYEDNPVPWIIGATAAVIVVGGLVAWALFGDD